MLEANADVGGGSPRAGPNLDGGGDGRRTSADPGVAVVSAAGPRAEPVLPTLTCVQTATIWKGKRQVGVWSVVSDVHGVLQRGLTRGGATLYARQHLEWCASLGELYEEVSTISPFWD